MEFIGILKTDLDVLLVHCEAGKRRSPAIAYAISLMFSEIIEDLPEIEITHPKYNKHVLNTMMKTGINVLTSWFGQVAYDPKTGKDVYP